MIRKKQVLTEYMEKSKNKTQENRIQILLTRKTKKSWQQTKFSIMEPSNRTWNLLSAQCVGTALPNHDKSQILAANVLSLCYSSWYLNVIRETPFWAPKKQGDPNEGTERQGTIESRFQTVPLLISSKKKNLEYFNLFFLSPISLSSVNKS